MTTITDAEIKQKGLHALIEALGEVDAERFITLLKREPFDYTIWQKEIFQGLDIYGLSNRAMKMRKKND